MGETKAETEVEVKTAAHKVHVHCGQCARDIETQFTEFHGVQEVKVDAGAGKVTVKGVGFDVEKLRVKVSKGCRKKVEFVPPRKDIVTEVKTKKEELKIITVKVPLHCPDCAVRVKEILLEHKSIYASKMDLGKNQRVIEGVIKEKKLTEYIYQRTRKHCVIEKVEKTLRIVEEKIQVKKKKDGEVGFFRQRKNFNIFRLLYNKMHAANIYYKILSKAIDDRKLDLRLPKNDMTKNIM